MRGSNGTPCQVWAGWLRATQGPHHTAHFPILMEYRLWLWLGAQSISSQVLHSLVASPGEEMTRMEAGRSRHPPPQGAPLDPILDCLVSISIYFKKALFICTQHNKITIKNVRILWREVIWTWKQGLGLDNHHPSWSPED